MLGSDATEALVLRPLPRGELLLHLNLSVSSASLDLRHLDLFPRAMAELVLGTGVAEAHLSLARGRWLDSRWGAHPEPAPTGAAMWAWLPASTHQIGWGGLRRALGAVVCAGLHDAMDVEEDAEDVEEAAPGGSGSEEEEGKVPSAAWGGKVDWRRMASPPAAVAPAPRVLRRAMTAREGVCTENLAALAQLWPCHDAAGLARLLAPDVPLRERLLRARHSSLRLRLLRTCAPGTHDGDGAAVASRGDARGDDGRSWETSSGEAAEAAASAEAAPAAAAVAAAGCRPQLTLRLGLTALLVQTTVPDVIAAVAEPTAPEPAAAVVASATSAAAGSAGGAARRGVRACPLCMSSWLQLQLPAGAAVHAVGSSGGASGGGGGGAGVARTDALGSARGGSARVATARVEAPPFAPCTYSATRMEAGRAAARGVGPAAGDAARGRPRAAERRPRHLAPLALAPSHRGALHGGLYRASHSHPRHPAPLTLGSPHRPGCIDQLQARARA